MTNQRKPIIGCAFDPDQRNARGIVLAYLAELEHYRPRGFYKLYREGITIANRMEREESGKATQPDKIKGNAFEHAMEWQDDCDILLSSHAQHCGMDFVSFGPFEHGGAIGYQPNIASAKEDSLVVADTSEVPHGYCGYVLHVNDHGNVSLYRSNRRGLTEIWAVV